MFIIFNAEKSEVMPVFTLPTIWKLASFNKNFPGKRKLYYLEVEIVTYT